MSGKSKYHYILENWEIEELQSVLSSKICSKEKRLRAYILLKCDSGQDSAVWLTKNISSAYDVSESKIYKVRKCMVEGGLEMALNRKKRSSPPTPRKLDGEQEAYLISLACIESPEGSVNWTLESLSKNLVELKIVDSISRECVRQTLKKTN